MKPDLRETFLAKGFKIRVVFLRGKPISEEAFDAQGNLMATRNLNDNWKLIKENCK